MNTLRYIALHHFAGLKNDPRASTQHFSLERINTAHKSRWPNFPSLLSLPNGQINYIGYNFIVFPDGTFFQARPLGSETAAQKGFNTSTISICVAGNFTEGVDKPTTAQLSTVLNLLLTLLEGKLSGMNLKVVEGTKFDLHLSRVFPHRYFQPDTECNALPENWGRNLVLSHYQEKISGLMKIVQILLLQLQTWNAKRKIGKAMMGAVDEKDYQCNL